MRAKLIEYIDFERGVDPKDAMNIGLPYVRAMSKMKPEIVYKSKDNPRWDYSMFFKKDDEIYYTFSTSRKVNNAYRFLDKHQGEDFPLDLAPLNKHFDKFLQKLTFVNEAVNFERGMDPKTSIGVGRIWNMTKEAVAKEIVDTCEKELEDLIQNVHAKARMKGYKNSYDYIAKAYNERGDANTDPVVENAIEELTGGIERIIDRYPVKKERDISNDITNFWVAGEPPFWTLIASIAPWLDDRLKESLDFERGVEPKKSMGVGMAKVIPNMVENLLRYDEDNGKGKIKEVRFYKEAVEFAVDVYDNATALPDEVTDKQRADYCRELIVKFHLDPFIVLNPVKLYRPMGIANFFFDLTEEGKKASPSKRYYLHIGDNQFTAEDNKVTSFVQDYLYAKTLQEAYNFERGIAPQKALGIGQKEMKEKLIKMFPDLSNNLLWDEMYKKIINGIKHKDTIVTISDEYIIVKSPILTWRFADNLRIMLNMSSEKVELEKKPSKEHIYLRGPEWMVYNYKKPRVYKYRIL